MTEPVFALAIATAIVLPHVLPLEIVAPAKASAVWMLALSLRALVAIGAVVYLLVYMPQTSLFQAVISWCGHAVLPLIPAHVGLSGHPFADIAVLIPGLALAASITWALFGLVRAWLALRSHLAERRLGEGPLGSTLIDDEEVVIAVSNLGRARVMVSKAALHVMDREELEAGVAHEMGHIHRRHRPLLLMASLLCSIGRLLPGTVAAHRAFIFSLERDADEYAVRRTRDPIALASAIFKAAGGDCPPVMAGLRGGGGLSLRLEYLLEGGLRRGGKLLEHGAGVLAVVMASIVLALSVAVPAGALAAPPSGAAHAGEPCSR